MHILTHASIIRFFTALETVRLFDDEPSWRTEDRQQLYLSRVALLSFEVYSLLLILLFMSLNDAMLMVQEQKLK